MRHYRYETSGVCSRSITFGIEDSKDASTTCVVHDCSFSTCAKEWL